MSKKFNKRILLQVPTTDKASKLLLEVGTGGHVIIGDGANKVGVLIKDLEEALHEVAVLAEIYKEQPKETDTKIDFVDLQTEVSLHDVGYEDEET